MESSSMSSFEQSLSDLSRLVPNSTCLLNFQKFMILFIEILTVVFDLSLLFIFSWNKLQSPATVNTSTIHLPTSTPVNTSTVHSTMTHHPNNGVIMTMEENSKVHFPFPHSTKSKLSSSTSSHLNNNNRLSSPHLKQQSANAKTTLSLTKNRSKPSLLPCTLHIQMDSSSSKTSPSLAQSSCLITASAKDLNTKTSQVTSFSQQGCSHESVQAMDITSSQHQS